MLFGVDEYDFKLSVIPISRYKFSSSTVIADRRGDRSSTGTCSGATFHWTVGKDAFPGKFNTFVSSHRRFTALTGVCSSSSTFCRLVTTELSTELSSYSWISFWIQLNFTLVWNFAEFCFLSSFLRPLWNPFSDSCCSHVFSGAKFNRPRTTQVQFRTALTAVYAGGENSWNSSIKVGGAVAESGRGSDTKIRAHFTVRWFL